MKEFTVCGIASIIGTTLTAAIGQWDALIQFLIIFMIADYATGIVKAIKKKKLNSEVMLWGAIRKASVLIVIMIATAFDMIVATDAPVFRTMAIYYYISREGISITENLGAIGVPMPRFIRSTLEQLHDQVEGSEEKGGKKNGKSDK